tara:strand:+ start:125 stop:655 length:531 start_codon:yes stop_codon:yes gene_type:complete
MDILNLFYIRKKLLSQRYLEKDQSGYSSIQMAVALACIGIVTTLTFPLLTPVIEIAEVLIAEKYLLDAVKECQMGLINGENYPSYTLPPQSTGLGFISTRRFQFPYSGINGECIGSSGGNILSAQRMNNNQTIPTFSLNINVVTGEKTFEGDLPSFIDWWEGFYSPFIQEDDPILL